MDVVINEEMIKVSMEYNIKAQKYARMFQNGHDDNNGDVIIMCNNGQIRTHSEVLLACSDFFANHIALIHDQIHDQNHDQNHEPNSTCEYNLNMVMYDMDIVKFFLNIMYNSNYVFHIVIYSDVIIFYDVAEYFLPKAHVSKKLDDLCTFYCKRYEIYNIENALIEVEQCENFDNIYINRIKDTIY